jgi:uncharacterized membrane protein YbhN (UPF0104 family)
LVKHRTALVSLLAVGLLVWFLRHANLGDVWHQVQRARMELLLVALLVVAATYWARAVRWHYLLVPIGHTRFRTVFRATIIGFAALGLLPARAGDVLRPYLVARQEGLSLSSVFATIVIERVLDLIAVLSLLALYLAVAADVSAMSPALLRSVVVSASVAGLLAALMIGVLWLVASHPERVGAAAGEHGAVVQRRTGRGAAAPRAGGRDCVVAGHLDLPCRRGLDRDTGLRHGAAGGRLVPAAGVAGDRSRGADTGRRGELS